jgi:tetratricopeptide (TPR) repeat protein
MSSANHNAQQMRRSKRVLFTAVALLIPLVFVLLIEGVVRLLIETPLVDDPFLNIGSVPSFFKTKTVDGKEYKIVTHGAAYGHYDIRFTTKKAPGVLRIICVGSSASAGWPQPKTESYSAHLEQALRRAFPHRNIEVLNLSAHAYASYRIRFLFDMLREFDPDAFVIYAGNNEFLEPRTYSEGRQDVMRFTTALNHSATFRLALYFVNRLAHPENSLAGSDREHLQYEMWSKVAKVTLTLREDPLQFAKVKEHYAFNISYMVAEAAKLRVPAIVVTVPVNLRDWHPNVARSALVGDAYAKWKDHFERGQAARLRGELAQAILLLRAAVEMDPTQAEGHYQLARAYEHSKSYPQALASYRQANDEDRNPFRAISAFNVSLREIASKYPNAVLADAEKAIGHASAPHAPGFDMFLDYVHPTRKGNLVIAESVFDALIRSGVLGTTQRNPAFSYEPHRSADGKTYDVAKDYFVQHILIDLFGVMHQYEALVNKAREYHDVPDKRLKNAPRVVEVFSPYLEVRRKLILGEPVSASELKSIRQRVRDFYGDTYKIADLPSEIF